jgi:heme exporter protein D
VSDVLGLGRYAPYILPAYGATALGFAWMVIDTVLRARRWRREARRLETDEAARADNDPS